jgi:hypothetical protein
MPRVLPKRLFSVLSVRWLLPLGGLLALLGYFGPWVDHPVAGLVILGLDLGEYVKFLVPVRSGQITVWREGFYLPLTAVSLAFSLYAFRRELGYGWPLRLVLLAVAAVAALNMLPPAWTPQRLLTPEFRLQTTAIVICLAAASISPFLALLPAWVSTLLVTLLVLPALWFPLRDFLRVLPTLRTLYNQPLSPGWGPYVLVVGLLLLWGGSLWVTRHALPTRMERRRGRRDWVIG